MYNKKSIVFIIIIPIHQGRIRSIKEFKIQQQTWLGNVQSGFCTSQLYNYHIVHIK